MFKLRSRKDQLDVSFEILLLTLKLPVPAPKRESRWSASEREVGHRDVVKFPGHDLVVLVFVGEWEDVFFLKRDSGRRIVKKLMRPRDISKTQVFQWG